MSYKQNWTKIAEEKIIEQKKWIPTGLLMKGKTHIYITNLSVSLVEKSTFIRQVSGICLLQERWLLQVRINP